MVTFSDVHALVELGKQRRVLGRRTVCLRLGVIISEDWGWAGGRGRWGTACAGDGGGVKERGRSNGALGGGLEKVTC